MVVCPCGVMVPAVGGTAAGAVTAAAAAASGKAKKAIRTPACLDPASAITTQPKEDSEKELQDETKYCVESLTGPPPGPIGGGDPKIPKGMSSKLSSESLRLEHTPRATTLALQPTKDSSRYVGTKHLRPNRSPTPTLHHLPAKNTSNSVSASKEQKSSNNNANRVRSNSVGGKIGTKHLPSVRTSPSNLASPTTPTSPMDNKFLVGTQKGKSKVSSRAASPAGSTLHRSNSKTSVLNAVNQWR